ncbi:MAG: hypothetical protein ACREDH_01600 [Methylocella sp.]
MIGPVRHLEGVGRWARSRSGPPRPIRIPRGKPGLAPNTPIAYVSQTMLSVDVTKSITVVLPLVPENIEFKLLAELSD